MEKVYVILLDTLLFDGAIEPVGSVVEVDIYTAKNLLHRNVARLATGDDEPPQIVVPQEPAVRPGPVFEPADDAITPEESLQMVVDAKRKNSRGRK